MPARPSRICAKCIQTAVAGTRYCAAHANSVAEADRQRKAANPLRTQFNYNCAAWRAARRFTLYQYPQCAQVDEQGARCPQVATEAHHIVNAQLWVAQGGNYLDQDNLAGLCRPCHSRHTQAERRGTVVPGSFAPPDNEWSPCI